MRVIHKKRVIVPYHIVTECDHSLSRKADASCRDAAVLAVCQPTFLPMPMRIENAGERAVPSTEWPIQITAQIKTRKCLKIHLLDAVTITGNPVKYPRLQSRFVRHGPKAATDKDLFADLLGPQFPFTLRGNRRKFPRGIKIFYRAPCLARSERANDAQQKRSNRRDSAGRVHGMMKSFSTHISSRSREHDCSLKYRPGNCTEIRRPLHTGESPGEFPVYSRIGRRLCLG